jgi:hypothetical protein
MKNKYMVGTLVLALVLLGLGTTQYAMAYMGDSTQKGPNYSTERESQITEAMNSGNYDSWKSLMNNRGRVSDVITKDNFAKFAEAWKLAKAGKTDEANQTFEFLSTANIHFEEGLVGAANFFSSNSTDRLKSYSIIVSGLLARPNSIKLLKQLTLTN